MRGANCFLYTPGTEHGDDSERNAIGSRILEAVDITWRQDAASSVDVFEDADAARMTHPTFY